MNKLADYFKVPRPLLYELVGWIETDPRSKDVAAWLERMYLEWRAAQEVDATTKQFARYLDIPPAAMSIYMQGWGLPQGRHLLSMGELLGPEIYKCLDIIPEQWYRLLANAIPYLKLINENA